MENRINKFMLVLKRIELFFMLPNITTLLQI